MEWGSQGGRNNDDEDIDDIRNEKSSPELAITKFQKRIFDDTRENDDYKESDEDSDRGGSWMDEKRKKDDEITALKKDQDIRNNNK